MTLREMAVFYFVFDHTWLVGEKATIEAYYSGGLSQFMPGFCVAKYVGIAGLLLKYEISASENCRGFEDWEGAARSSLYENRK